MCSFVGCLGGVPYDTEERTPLLDNPPTPLPHMNTPGDKSFGSFFGCHFIAGGTLDATHHTEEVRLKTASNSKLITLPGG